MAGVECGKFDLDGLPQDEIIALEQVLWVKAQVEEKIFNVHRNNGKSSLYDYDEIKRMEKRKS